MKPEPPNQLYAAYGFDNAEHYEAWCLMVENHPNDFAQPDLLEGFQLSNDGHIYYLGEENGQD